MTTWHEDSRDSTSIPEGGLFCHGTVSVRYLKRVVTTRNGGTLSTSTYDGDFLYHRTVSTRSMRSVSDNDTGHNPLTATWSCDGGVSLSPNHLTKVYGKTQWQHGVGILGYDFDVWRRFPLPWSRLEELYREVQRFRGTWDTVSTSLRSVGFLYHGIGGSRQCGETRTRLHHGTGDPFVMELDGLVDTTGRSSTTEPKDLVSV